MLRSELTMLMISKALLTLNGKSSIKNYKKSMMWEPTSSSQNCPSEISLPNGSQIEASSVLEESLTKISGEWPKPLVLPCKPLLIMWALMSLEHVENSKRNKLELKDTTCSRSVLQYFQIYSDKICYNYLERWSRTIYQIGWEIFERCYHDRSKMFQDQ